MAQRSTIEVDFVPLPTVVAQGYFVTAAALDNMVEPVTEISQFISDQISKKFDDAGPGWPEHAPATILRWGEHDLLQLSGDLRSEVTSESAWDIARVSHGAVGTFNPDNAGDAFSNYGIFHIEGTENMPARNFLDLDPSAEDEAEDIFDRWVDEKLALF